MTTCTLMLAGLTAYSMLTHDGRRMVSHVEGTNTVYELVPTNQLPAGLPPAREWKLYGLKATHTDIGLHNSQYIQRHGTVKRIDEAARLIDADTRADDDPAAYRYVMEGFWFWDNYHQDKGMDAAWRIVTNYVARGRMDVGVTCAGNHTHLFSETEIERSTITKRILAEKWGIGTRTFIMADNPGISCSVIAPYSRAGIKYGLFLPNQWNPIPSTIWRKNESISAGTWNPDAMGGGARVEVSYDSPLPMVFRWKAPGGDESLLMWCSTQYGHGYSRLGISGRKKSAVDDVERLMPKFLGILEGKYPYDIWIAATYGDDESPNTKFADFAAEWNAKWAWPQFRTVGRLDEPFEYLEAKFGDKIPTLTGEMTSGWLQHAASTPELLADKLNADRMLETAERLGSFAETIDQAAVDRAWWYLILNDEHSYGTSGYQGRRVFETWMQHRDWIERAAAIASNELAKAVAKLGLFTNTTHNSQLITHNSQLPTRLNNPVKDGIAENRWYRVVVTNGVIYSIYDKELRRELIDGPANKFLYTRDNHKTWERNPEAALGAKVTRQVYLPDDTKRIDVVDTFEHARDLFNSCRYYRYGYLAFPFAVPGGRFAAHLNGTVIRPYEDCHPMTSDAYCAVRDWCAVENADFGVALMMRDSTLTEFGEIHPDKTCYAGRPPEGKTSVYPYLFADWLQMHQPDGDSMNFMFRFSITSYSGDWKKADVPRICEEWIDPYAKWMRENNVPRVARDAVAEQSPEWTGLIEKPRAGHGEEDGQMYVLWGAEMSPNFDHYELYRDGKFLSIVTNEVYDGIPYRVARYEDLGLPTHSRHEYQLRKVWKDGRKDALGDPFCGLTRFLALADECAKSGEPMLRSMEYAFPGNGYSAIKDQFVMGDFLIVAPQIEKGAESCEVRLPAGRWLADDGEIFTGPARITVKTPLSRLPHFVADVSNPIPAQGMTQAWRPSVRWRGFNLLGMFCQTKMGTGDKRIFGYFPEDRFQWMQEWGFNFARLPLDYRFFVEKDDWMKPVESQLEKLDEAVRYGKKHGIHIQINFHRAPGYCCNPPQEQKSLFRDPEPLAAFTNLWSVLAKRYRGIPNKELSFDLVNEPAPVAFYGATPSNYAVVARAAFAAIRAVDPDRFVMSDGWRWGKEPVKELRPFDPASGESIHSYEPQSLTHYRVFDKNDQKPCPPWPPKGCADGVEWLERNYVDAWRSAIDDGTFLFVGELGCCQHTGVPHATYLAWLEDTLKVCERHGWGWALWNLDGMFGILDTSRTDCELEDFHGHKLDRKALELLKRY